MCSAIHLVHTQCSVYTKMVYVSFRHSRNYCGSTPLLITELQSMLQFRDIGKDQV